jgi:hypothetical protein
MLEQLLAPAVKAFIRDHDHSDLHQLLLKRDRYPGIPVGLAVDQIRSRARAKYKLPQWHRQEGIVFPPPLSIEQCSSAATANFKAGWFTGENALDLTGGAGVDSYYLSRRFKRLIYVEQNAILAEIARHNFTVLGADNITVNNSSAELFLSSTTELFDLIYIDPARRMGDKKVFRWQDATPNVIELQSALVDKAKKVLIKGSPLMDIQLATHQLAYVEEVIVVAVNNEVKELLLLLNRLYDGPVSVRASNVQDNNIEEFKFYLFEEKQEELLIGKVNKYLYEPNAAILKSGGFKTVARKFNLIKLHLHTHLYTGDKSLPNFPGRVFSVNSILPFSKQELNSACPSGKANITVRNFPLSVAAIRKQTGLKDGGDQYLFAVTDYQNKKRILICEQLFNT